jgi:threonyl-tRNA synthetase
MERFMGVLIEHYAGVFPVWLAPVQAIVLDITDHQSAYAAQIEKSLMQQGFRVVADLRNEKIGYKIREHALQRVPYLLVVGDREVAANSVAVRTRGGDDLGSMTLSALEQRLQADIAQRGRSVVT